MTADAEDRAPEAGVTVEHIVHTLGRVGISLDQEQLQTLVSYYDMYRKPVAALHALDLDDEESAGAFEASWPPELGSA